MRTIAPIVLLRRILLSVCVVLGFSAVDFAPNGALAQATGGAVVDGQAVIHNLPTGIEVIQHSDRAVINWDSFSIGAGHSANFLLPHSTSAVLNRVTTPGLPSEIFGSINSNGSVFLINPAGILIGPTGTINTNGFTASALDIPNAEFMRGGNLHFHHDGGAAGSVINQGVIHVGAGGAALLGGEVVNAGTIISDGGSISLVVGNDVTLTAAGKYIQADMPTLLNGVSEYAGVINNTGVVRATGAAQIGGEVYLVNPNGKVLQAGLIAAQKQADDGALAGGDVIVAGKQTEVTGTINAAGVGGGKVVVTGDEVQLTGATLDASGDTVGGVVLVGGGFQGSDSTVKNAQNLAVDADSALHADARISGDGGLAVVYAAGRTSFAGLATARALGVVGNGGVVEVSGLDMLNYLGRADTSSVGGNTGMLFLDPTNFDINTGFGLPNSSSTGVFWLNLALASNNVVIATGSGAGAGEIRVNAGVNWSSNNSLALLAHGNIRANADVQNNGSGNVYLIAGWNGTTGGPLSTGINSPATININTFLSNPASYGNMANGGNVFIGTSTNTSGVAVGGANGATYVLSNNLTLRGSDSNRAYAQLGYFHTALGTPNSTIASGAINVYAKGNATLQAGDDGATLLAPSSYAQIGHGGYRIGLLNFNYTGAINVNVGGNLSLSSATAGTGTYAQIGHGGNLAVGTHSGAITVNVVGNLNQTANSSANGRIATIGHSSSGRAGFLSGDIQVQVDGNATLTGALIGHDTSDAARRTSGNTFVGVGQGVSETGALTADASSQFFSAASAQLRFYMPDRSSWAVAQNASLNGVAAPNPAILPRPNERFGYDFGQGGAVYSPTAPGTNYALYYLHKLLLTVIGSGTSVYGDPPGAPSYTIVGLDPGDTVSPTSDLASVVTNNTDVGSYNFNVFLTSDKYDLTPASGGMWQVTPTPLTITADNQSKTFGTTFVFNGTEFTAIGLKNGETFSAALSSPGAAAGADVGTYDITIGALTDLGTGTNAFKETNYAITRDGLEKLAVTPASLMLTISNQTKTYGQSFTFNGVPGTPGADVAVAGLQNSDAITNVVLYTLGGDATLPTANAGGYTITADVPTGITGNASFKPTNYDITLTPGMFTINPAPLTLIANNQFKYADYTFFFDGTTMFTAVGLKNGETIASVGLSSVGAPVGAPFGTYPIEIFNPVGGTAVLSNYAITLQPGVLVVGNSVGSFVYDQFTRYEYYRDSIETLPNGGVRLLGAINYGAAAAGTGPGNLVNLNSFRLFGPAPQSPPNDQGSQE